jgi:hypothetical protein
MAERGIVLVPMMMAVAEGAREMGVPETVMGGPPGVRVWVSIMYWDWEFKVMSGGSRVKSGANVMRVGTAAGIVTGELEGEEPGARV